MQHESALRNLEKEFSGELIAPGDGRYNDVKDSYSGTGDPALVARPITAGDAAAAVRFARETGPALSVRSGGHGVFNTNTGGLVVDLSAMNGIELLDGERRIVRLGPGARWGRVADALGEIGLALSSGDTRSVGVGGLTLGGGIGWMVRKYGLAIDSLRAAEVVTADSRILRASESENGDLFWALRGGGGNFGIVTAFEFEAHPVREVVSGTILFDPVDAAGALEAYRDCLREAPDELTATLFLLPPLGGNPASAQITFCFAEDDEWAALEALAPLLKAPGITGKDIAKKPYAGILVDAQKLPGSLRIAVRNSFAGTFTDGLIAAVAEAWNGAGNAVVQIRSLGGAMSRVDPGSTAFFHRESEVNLSFASFFPSDLPAEAADAAMNRWEPVAALTSGAYANFLTATEAADIRSIYPEPVYSRLSEIKKTYDPGNLFNRNWNVAPA